MRCTEELNEWGSDRAEIEDNKRTKELKAGWTDQWLWWRLKGCVAMEATTSSNSYNE